MSIKVIGHRGNGRTTESPFTEGKAPQHTLRSFEQAVANGAEGVEFDVFMTRDAIPVIVDKDVVFGHTVALLDCADVQGITIGLDDRIPTLEQTLILLNDLNNARAPGRDKLFINIELKGPGAVAATVETVHNVAGVYGLDKDCIHYSTTDRDRLCLVRALEPDAHIQPTILTNELFRPLHVQQPGFHVPPHESYDRDSLRRLERFIVAKRCRAIDTPTGDIRRPLIDLADRLDVGFCTHPTGPRRVTDAKHIYRTIGLLNEFARSASDSRKVVLKVDDINATRTVISASERKSRTPVNAMERMMGVPFLKQHL